MLKTLFPLSQNIKDLSSLIIRILIFLVMDIICGTVIGLFASLPAVGFIFAAVGSIVGLYFLTSIVIAVLDYMGIV